MKKYYCYLFDFLVHNLGILRAQCVFYNIIRDIYDFHKKKTPRFSQKLYKSLPHSFFPNNRKKIYHLYTR